MGIGIFLGLLLWLHSNLMMAQLSLPLNHLITQKVELSVADPYGDFITCMKPFNEKQLNTFLSVDSVLRFDTKNYTSWFGRKLWKESFLKLDSPGFHLEADPLFNLALGEDRTSQKKLFINTRGLQIRGVLGKNLGFETSFYENQGQFPEFWDNYIFQKKVSPGQGRAKRYHNTGWDYAFSSGTLQWQACKFLYIQLGHGKNFIGDGYRSLFLSDVSTNYPYIRLSFNWMRLHYTRIIASLMNLDYKVLGLDTKEFPKKTANFHLITVSLPKKIQLSFFEGTVIGNPDSQGRFKLNMDVISPLPFLDYLKSDRTHLHPVSGINLRWQPYQGLALYHQSAVDFDQKSKIKSSGIQLGAKFYNAFGIPRLFLQAEFNRVLPFMYSNTDSTIAYAHYSQPLAHPLGSNFTEWVGIMQYQWHHWSVYEKTTLAKYGEDNLTFISGKDILKPLPTNATTTLYQGQPVKLTTMEGAITFTFNPKNQMGLSAGFLIQTTDYDPTRNIASFYVSFRTSLSNLYYDFR